MILGWHDVTNKIQQIRIWHTHTREVFAVSPGWTSCNTHTQEIQAHTQAYVNSCGHGFEMIQLYHVKVSKLHRLWHLCLWLWFKALWPVVGVQRACLVKKCLRSWPTASWLTDWKAKLPERNRSHWPRKGAVAVPLQCKQNEGQHQQCPWWKWL